MNTKIGICFINDFPSLMEGISVLTGVSKNQIKKYLTKKELAQKVYPKGEFSIPINILNNNKVNPKYSGPKINVLFEDENFIALSKPEQIHCHPLSYDEVDNVLSFLYSLSPKLLKVNDKNYDRGLFYRLDYETSGLLYYAKSSSIQQKMRSTFLDIVKTKKYLAVVKGRAKDAAILVNKLETSGLKGRKVILSDNGVECESSYKLLDYNPKEDLSLIEVELKQGHKHQLRVQLSHVDLPILGDPLYSSNKSHRMFLHCHQYEFEFEGIKYNIKDFNFELKGLFTNFNS